jgi:hypothetical protein
MSVRMSWRRQNRHERRVPHAPREHESREVDLRLHPRFQLRMPAVVAGGPNFVPEAHSRARGKPPIAL